MQALEPEDRQRVAGAMRGIAERHPFDSRAERFETEALRFEQCGLESLLVQCDICNSKYYTPIKCRSRVCDSCGSDFYGVVVERFREIVKLMLANKRKGYFTSLLTLTFQKSRFGDHLPDAGQLRRCYLESSAFFRLFCGRYRGVFSKSGRVREDRKHWRGAGSISVVEVGQDNNNVHVHAVVYMPFTALSVLKRAWARITGDSFVLRLDRARNVDHVVGYLLKYITKPPATDSFERLAEYAWMVKGFRRLRSSGLFYNHLSLRELKPRRPCYCPVCGGRVRPYGYEATEDAAGMVADLWRLLRDVERSGELISYDRYSEELSAVNLAHGHAATSAHQVQRLA